MHLVSNTAYVGDTPWHGLGNQLSPKQPIEAWARQGGMDWTIESADVRFVGGNASASASHLGSIYAFPEQRMLYGSDIPRPTHPIAMPLPSTIEP